ncbi:hypothetical protein [Polaribacter sp. Hel1_85]|uniref:hypothetical protein n=1 Tax=Polaribacter sp. Hel1_85 TaxID=1250005 RepID=UPI00052C2F5C|nr:hypothetical protein [Polaribacter sp. Hel1_85]KGL63367.1 hypothetical protein PHEL85_0403 [Polaribacter sp. Hel1_85]
MKLFYSSLLFIFLFSSTSISQNNHFVVHESQKYIDQFKSTNILNIYTTDNDLNVIARKSKTYLVFETFDNKAKGKKIKTVKLSKKESFVGELFYNNQLRIFMVESPSKTERILHCYTYNVASNNYTKVTLLETTVKKKSALFSGQNKRQTNFSISPNKKFIAITTDIEKKNSNSYNIHVYNAENLELTYSKSYYSNTEKYYRSSDMVVDDNAVVYNVGKEYFKGKRERKNAKANYSYVINKIDKDNIETSAISLKEDEYIQSLNLSFVNDNLRLIGYYSEDKVFGIKGVSTFIVDTNNLEVIEKKKQKLPLKVFEDLYGYRNAKNKKNAELTSFTLDYLLEDEEGNTYLVAEEFYVTQVYVSNGMNGGMYVTTYHYDDILITKLDADGNLNWGRSIFKRDTSPSYNAFLNNGKLHVLLNSGKNLTAKTDGRLKVSKGWFESSSLYVFLYDKDGNVSHEKIQDNKGKTKYIPYKGSFADGKFVMYNHSKSKKQLMILDCK